MNISKTYFVLFNLICFLLPSCKLPPKNQGLATQSYTPTAVETVSYNASNQITVLFMQCNSPCWLGIVPGQTTRKDAVASLEKHYGNNSFRSMSTNFVEWASNNNDISKGGIVGFLNNVVTDVYVWVDKDKFNMHDLVQILGEPDLVFVAKTFTSDPVCIKASVFYSTEGIVASLYPMDKVVGIQETQYVSSLSFLSPQLSIQAEPTDSFITNWEGFRDYCPSS